MTPRRSDIEIRETSDGYVLTARAPRDGCGRETSAADLSYPMTPEEFDHFVNRCVWLRAGRKA